MKTERLIIELTYDDEVMYGNDPEAIAWFWDEVMGDDLILHSNLIGDEVGRVRLVRYYERDAMTDGQRCGNCGWWEFLRAASQETVRIGACLCPLPVSLDGSRSLEVMYHGEGTDCPCWKAREDEK